jgi:sirohydrochlorin ferrochelatase
MPEALLVMVHGSPKPSANNTMFGVVDRFRERPDAAGRFPIVEVGFMECNEPDIPEAVERCVCDDLPTLLEDAQARYPNISFAMGDYIGLSPAVTGLLSRRAAEASPATTLAAP